jgi:hypothetical protein
MNEDNFSSLKTEGVAGDPRDARRFISLDFQPLGRNTKTLSKSPLRNEKSTAQHETLSITIRRFRRNPFPSLRYPGRHDKRARCQPGVVEVCVHISPACHRHRRQSPSSSDVCEYFTVIFYNLSGARGCSSVR